MGGVEVLACLFCGHTPDVMGQRVSPCGCFTVRHATVAEWNSNVRTLLANYLLENGLTTVGQLRELTGLRAYLNSLKEPPKCDHKNYSLIEVGESSKPGLFNIRMQCKSCGSEVIATSCHFASYESSLERRPNA